MSSHAATPPGRSTLQPLTPALRMRVSAEETPDAPSVHRPARHVPRGRFDSSFKAVIGFGPEWSAWVQGGEEGGEIFVTCPDHGWLSVSETFELLPAED